MAKIFIDFRDEDPRHEGRFQFEIIDANTMDATEPSLRIADHELIFTTSQLCELRDFLTKWLGE